VAASGGRDSTALLHATACAALGTRIEVHALHVHHGLMPQADEWLRALRGRCQRWARAGLPVFFHARRLKGGAARGESVEAWARRERYAALAAMARELDIDTVLLAHHRRDQAETILLQLLRGGGMQAMAAMPACAERAGVRFVRPWLGHSRQAIEAYVHRHRLRFVDDASNADRRFARARLRSEVWPALAGAFPDAELTLAAAAARAAETAACAEALAAIDAQSCIDGDGRLVVIAWRSLELARRANLLRHWLKPQLVGGVPDSLVARLLEELPPARSGARWPAGGGALGLHRGRLGAIPAADSGVDRGPAQLIDLSHPGRHRVPGWGGMFEVTIGTGLPAQLLRWAEIRPRAGGEQFQQAPGTPPRRLKKQFQALGQPAWARTAPLVYAGGALVFVPGLGVDARAPTAIGAAGRVLHWVAEP
jgi:tRNA(Ile)-lysidine synthase